MRRKKNRGSNERRSLRDIFFKRAFYDMLIVNKAMVNSKLSSSKGNIYFEKYTIKNLNFQSPKGMSQRSNCLPKLLANVYMVPFKGSEQFLFLCKPCVVKKY